MSGMEDYIPYVKNGIAYHKLASWCEFINYLNQGDRFKEYVWRGQRQLSWNLLPSIYRTNYGNLELKALKLFYIQAQGILRDLHSLPKLNFETPAHGETVTLNSDDAIKWWSVAQHYGLPTPLLDWSNYALVALFFAIRKINLDSEKNTKICIWALQKPFVSDDVRAVFEPELETSTDEDVYPSDEFGLYFYNQDNWLNPRVTAQGGLFTFLNSSRKKLGPEVRYDVKQFYEDHQIGTKSRPHLHKITIPINGKKDLLKCRYFLAQSGITAKTLFPDLHGITEDCIFRLQNNYYTTGPVGTTSRDATLKIKYAMHRRKIEKTKTNSK